MEPDQRKRKNSVESADSSPVKKKQSQDPQSSLVANVRDQLRIERKNLPIRAARKQLLRKLAGLPGGTAIVIGETGSGKTTQIPQYIYEAGLYKGGIIGCTQPRRVAAVTVAQRVASEMGSNLGHLVGYNVRFEDVTSPETSVIYMTDGMLLREALLDPLLKRYSVIILDEAHERTVHTDVLFGVVKSAQRRRLAHRDDKKLSPLQVIVMSATMDVDHFSKYFNNAPVLYIEGRQHKVELFYSQQSQPDYIFSSLVTVFQIHRIAPPHEGILVFLTGQEEIESVVKSVRDISKDLPSGSPSIFVCPLYSALPPSQQLKVFEPAAKGTRKVIISTNIAETSVTIKGIKYVVDCGRVKAKSFKPTSGLDLLAVQWISKAQAWQRTGRAGREAPGVCYRLYTEDDFDNLANNTTPEILRCNLASVVLQLLAIGVTNIASFDFMDKPSPESLKLALEQLNWLGAVSSTESPSLTDTGRQLAAFPLDPKLATVLRSASNHNCLNEMLTVVAMLSVESVLHTPHSKREEALAVRRKFTDNDSDHLTMLNIYQAYENCKGNKANYSYLVMESHFILRPNFHVNWCHENFINARNMKQVTDIRNQLRNICVNLRLAFNSCETAKHLSTAIRKCLCAGFFMNAAERVSDGDYVTVATRKRVTIHPSSSLFHRRPDCVVYNDLVQTTKCYMSYRLLNEIPHMHGLYSARVTTDAAFNVIGELRAAAAAAGS